MEQILKCLCAGLFMNACFLHHSGTYKTLRGDQCNLHISPNSCLYNAQQPQWYVIVFIIMCLIQKLYCESLFSYLAKLFSNTMSLSVCLSFIVYFTFNNCESRLINLTFDICIN